MEVGKTYVSKKAIAKFKGCGSRMLSEQSVKCI
jgi:hypothetical protein